MNLPFENPHDFPLDRPFLVRMDIGGAQSYVPAYVLFPHERTLPGKKLEPALLAELNYTNVVGMVDDDYRMTGWVDLPEDANILLQYRCPHRYENSEISRSILQEKRDLRINELQKRIDNFNQTNHPRAAKEYSEKLMKLLEKPLFDPLFSNGVYVGCDPEPTPNSI